MSLKTFFYSTLFAATTLAQDYGSGGSSYGSGGSWGSGNGMSSWSSASGGQGPPALAAASCPSGCQPMQTGAAPPPMSTQPGQLIVQVVSVSDNNGSLKYFPNNVQAPVGSIVQFQYHPKNHTITESSFAAPCMPLAANLTSPTRPGLKSGFVPVTGMEPFTPVFNVLINDTKPIWIYCGQTNHCEKGMAMSINQNNSSPNTIEAYIANAAMIPLVSVPTPPSTSTSAPPVFNSPPPPPPAAETSSATFAFGGGAPPPPASAPPAAETATTSAFAPPAVATVTPPASSVGVAPAVFTGAAAPASLPQLSSAFAGVVLGALLAVW